MIRKLVLIVISLLLPAVLMAAEVDRIVVFGDSLSDSGNMLHYSTAAHDANPVFPILPIKPYHQGHFTNGITWAEQFQKLYSKKLGHTIPFSDYAVGGSTALADDFLPGEMVWPVHSLQDEVYRYLDHQSENIHDANRDQHLFLIWIGANDYLYSIAPGRSEDPEAFTTHVVKNTISAIRNLIINAGARKFIVINLPDLGKAPGGNILGPNVSRRLSQLTTLHNQKLADSLATLQLEFPNVTLLDMDIHTPFDKIMSEKVWQDERFADVSFPCYGGSMSKSEARRNAEHFNLKRMLTLHADLHTNMPKGFEMKACSNPDDHFFWDFIHPTARVHRLIANHVFEQWQQLLS